LGSELNLRIADWVPVPLPEVVPTKEQRVYESAVYETQSNMSPIYEMPV
jgi:hypothetical protein